MWEFSAILGVYVTVNVGVCDEGVLCHDKLLALRVSLSSLGSSPHERSLPVEPKKDTVARVSSPWPIMWPNPMTLSSWP